MAKSFVVMSSSTTSWRSWSSSGTCTCKASSPPLPSPKIQLQHRNLKLPTSSFIQQSLTPQCYHNSSYPLPLLRPRRIISALDSDLPRPLHQGMFTGLLGNLSLLSYFAKKREKEAIVVQTLGIISLFVVFHSFLWQKKCLYLTL